MNLGGQPEFAVDRRLHHRHPAAPPDDQNPVDTLRAGLRLQFGEGFPGHLQAEVEQVGGQFLELLASHLDPDVIPGKRERERVLELLRQPLFGGFRLGSHFLVGVWIGERVDAMFRLELRGQPGDQPVVPILPPSS